MTQVAPLQFKGYSVFVLQSIGIPESAKFKCISKYAKFEILYNSDYAVVGVDSI